jgi:hypothetical protein
MPRRITAAVRSRTFARLRDERGIALIMALGILFVLTITLTTVIYMTSASARHAERSNAGQKAYGLAEAGVNNALSVLYETYSAGAVDYYTPGDVLPEQTRPYDGGNVTWRGVYCMATGSAEEVAAGCNPTTDYALWRIRATGTVANPTGPGASDVKRTINAKVQAILPSGTPPSSGLWNWVFSGAPPSPRPVCDVTVPNSVTVLSPLYVTGNLCLQNGAEILQPAAGQENRLVVGGFLRIDQNNSTVGKDGTGNRLTEAHIGGLCTYKGNDSGSNWNYRPCGDSENVFVLPGKLYSTPPVDPVTAPTVVPIDAPTCPVIGECIDLDRWYVLSHPGPRHPCVTASTTGPGTVAPPLFDNDTVRNNSLATVQNLTPNASYTCKTVAGELSWDNATKVLTVNGPLFIDGSVQIDTGAVATYSGRSTIYVSGTFVLKSGIVCARKNAAGNNCDFDNWDPNAASGGNALAIAAFGSSSNGGLESQEVGGSTPDVGIQVKSGTIQALLYARSNIEIVTTSRAQGPMVTPKKVFLGQTGAGTFPPFALVPTGTPGTPVPPATLGPAQDFSGG